MTKRMYAIILVVYKLDPQYPGIRLITQETVLETVYGRRKAEEQVKYWKKQYGNTKLIDVTYQPLISRSNHGE